MRPRTILLLEDDEDRIVGFRRVVASLGPEYCARIWHNASAMIAAAPACFAEACLISLDHDLQPVPGETDPGSGFEVAEFLSLHQPVCPVILHTSNSDGRMRMRNKLRAGGWTVATVPPREIHWIQASWLPVARRLIRL